MENLLAWKPLIVFPWLGAVFLLERWRPFAPWKVAEPQSGFTQPRHLLQNLSLGAINGLLSPLVVIPVTAAAALAAPEWRPPWLQGGAGLLLDLLMLDLWIYVWHRANHRLPWLWRFHQVHHLDEQLDATSALRFHFGEVLLSALARAPVVFALDMTLASVVIFEILVAVVTIFHHANIRLAVGIESFLSRFVITPRIHWVHHHAVRRDTDSNYGTLLSIWDRWLGTRSFSRRDPGMMLGVEGRRENRLPVLLGLPFLAPADGGTGSR